MLRTRKGTCPVRLALAVRRRSRSSSSLYMSRSSCFRHWFSAFRSLKCFRARINQIPFPRLQLKTWIAFTVIQTMSIPVVINHSPGTEVFAVIRRLNHLSRPLTFPTSRVPQARSTLWRASRRRSSSDIRARTSGGRSSSRSPLVFPATPLLSGLVPVAGVVVPYLYYTTGPQGVIKMVVGAHAHLCPLGARRTGGRTQGMHSGQRPDASNRDGGPGIQHTVHRSTLGHLPVVRLALEFLTWRRMTAALRSSSPWLMGIVLYLLPVTRVPFGAPSSAPAPAPPRGPGSSPRT